MNQIKSSYHANTDYNFYFWNYFCPRMCLVVASTITLCRRGIKKKTKIHHRWINHNDNCCHNPRYSDSRPLRRLFVWYTFSMTREGARELHAIEPEYLESAEEKSSLDILYHDGKQETTTALLVDIRRLKDEIAEIYDNRIKIENSQHYPGFVRDAVSPEILKKAEEPLEALQEKLQELKDEYRNRRFTYTVRQKIRNWFHHRA